MRDDYGQAYADLYHQHWWWRAREAFILDQIRSLSLPPHADILDVGCGNGLMLPSLAAFGNVQGIEVDTTLIDPDHPLRDRIHTHPLEHPAYDRMRFDLITALDVVEHIEDDQLTLARMYQLLKPGGIMLVTVPAFNLLWDRHDDINHHHRRYTRRSLARALPDTPMLESRYFFHALVLPKLMVKLINLVMPRPIAQHRLPRPWVNRMMYRLCRLEQHVCRHLPVPAGTSVLVMLRKPITLHTALPLRHAA